MRMKLGLGVLWILLLVGLLTLALPGCSRSGSREARPDGGQQPYQPVADADAKLGPDDFLAARLRLLKTFFDQYYAGLAAGNQTAITAMTHGEVSSHILGTMAAHKGKAYTVVSVGEAAGGIYEPLVAVAVTVRQGGAEQTDRYRLTLVDGHWRVTDVIDPQSPNRWLTDRSLPEYQMVDLFAAYYAARARGDRAAVTRMTGGAYQERALTTLGQTPPPEQVLRAEFWSGLPGETAVVPTVVHLRGGKEGALTFRVEAVSVGTGLPAEQAWRIVDLLDPQSGRWLSDRRQSIPLPAVLQPGLQAFVREFYQARSYTDIAAYDISPIYRLAANRYELYLHNLVRGLKLKSELFELESVQVTGWRSAGAPESGDGEADLLVTRRYTQVKGDGSRVSTSGTARLRAERSGGTWRVVDGFAEEEGAWVSTLAWKGLMVAA